jgi:hypothetical protein
VLGLLLGACSAGQYDIQECDPSVPNLEKDLCNQLNLNMDMGLSSCMLYQCDNVSRRCVLKPRDYDRDGDPAIACGGCDCDDTDPTVYCEAREVCDNKDNNCNGVKDEGCSCNPDTIGKDCYDGTGACQGKGVFVCQNNVPFCTAMRTPSQGWHNFVNASNGSADWNCNGMDEFACCNDPTCNSVVGCALGNCFSGDPNAVCAGFCNAGGPGNCAGRLAIYRCEDKCPGTRLVCHCALTFNFVPCQPSGSFYDTLVGCQ